VELTPVPQATLAMLLDQVTAKLREIGNEPMPGVTPERTRGFIAAEIDKWVPIVRATGATID
jgi:hypothetical protein